MKNQIKNYTNQLLKKLRNEKYTQLLQTIWSEEVFIIKKVKNTVPSTYVINDLNDEETVGTFYEKYLQKNKSKNKKDNKLYGKWERHNNLLSN